jgi:anaerobic ribonucleoside-triphosphate reductase
VRAALRFQEETGHLYNLEATPAEGTTYRFAKEDRKRYPDILQPPDAPYYTNSSQLPVGFTDPRRPGAAGRTAANTPAAPCCTCT